MKTFLVVILTFIYIASFVGVIGWQEHEEIHGKKVNKIRTLFIFAVILILLVIIGAWIM